MEIRFSSLLQTRYRDDLESLVFFNPNQASVTPGIITAVDRYGSPMIVADGEFLRLAVAGLYAVQDLYAFVERGEHLELAGVIIYTRTDTETIVVLHIAVKDEYSFYGKYSHEMLTIRLLAKLREIAHQIRGVRSIMILYGEGGGHAIPVRN